MFESSAEYKQQGPFDKTGKDVESGFLSMPFVPSGTKCEDFSDALEQVKANQPPQLNAFTRSLVQSLRELMKIKEGVPLNYYTAVGTHLDFCYGIDAFFEIGPLRVTIDVTTNPNKENRKADIIVYVGVDAEGNIIFTEADKAQLAQKMRELFIAQADKAYSERKQQVH